MFEAGLETLLFGAGPRRLINLITEFINRNDRVRVVVVPAVHVEAERRSARLDWPTDGELQVALLAGLFDQLLRLTRVEAIAAKRGVDLAAPVRVRPRDDLHLRSTCVVVVG